MSTPERAHASAQKWGYALRRPIPRGAAFDRPPRYAVGDRVQCRNRVGRVADMRGTDLWIEFEHGGGVYPWRADQVALVWRAPAADVPQRHSTEIEEDEPVHTGPTQSRPEGCSATLLNIVLIVIVLGFAVWGVRQTGILNAIGAPAQTTIDAPRDPTPTRPPRPTPTQIPPYDNAAHNATAEALQEAPEATEAPPDIPIPAPAWHPPMAMEYDVCAAWRVPMPWPAECGAQQGWHAPLVVRP